MNSFGTDKNAPWFPQMVSYEAAAVGCSIFKYRLQNHMVCVYSNGNDVRGASVYSIGPMASSCPKINPKYPGLCSAPKFRFPIRPFHCSVNCQSLKSGFVKERKL